MTPHLVRFNGDEFEAMTKGGRRVHRFRPGNRARIKRRFRRRERRTFNTIRGLMDEFAESEPELRGPAVPPRYYGEFWLFRLENPDAMPKVHRLIKFRVPGWLARWVNPRRLGTAP